VKKNHGAGSMDEYDEKEPGTIEVPGSFFVRLRFALFPIRVSCYTGTLSNPKALENNLILWYSLFFCKKSDYLYIHYTTHW